MGDQNSENDEWRRRLRWRNLLKAKMSTEKNEG